MAVEPAAVPFQTCGSCGHAWSTWEGFIRDPAIRLVGLQAVITPPDVNLLIFEHHCGSSISILSKRLRHLLPEPEPAGPHARLLGTEECRQHCRVLEDWEKCDAACGNARDRRLIQLVQGVKRDVG
jgi:hypothetical protein